MCNIASISLAIIRQCLYHVINLECNYTYVAEYGNLFSANLQMCVHNR